MDRATEVTPANVLDYKLLEAVILGEEKELYADTIKKNDGRKTSEDCIKNYA